MKIGIERHKQGLENMKEYRDRITLDIERRQLDLHRLESDIAFLTLQIEIAVKHEMTGFDEDRFLIKRKKK